MVSGLSIWLVVSRDKEIYGREIQINPPIRHNCGDLCIACWCSIEAHTMEDMKQSSRQNDSYLKTAIWSLLSFLIAVIQYLRRNNPSAEIFLLAHNSKWYNLSWRNHIAAMSLRQLVVLPLQLRSGVHRNRGPAIKPQGPFPVIHVLYVPLPKACITFHNNTIG